MTTEDSLLVLRGPDIRDVLTGKEVEIMAAVKEAYCQHSAGNSFLPHSVFVRFPGREKERIIALPGYLGGNDETAGIKWIASFPGNMKRGMSRASAITVLNSLSTGRPEALLEGSLISAARTAASAALAADVLHRTGDIDVLGMVGCGLISREIMKFISSLPRKIGEVLLYDVTPEHAARYGDHIGSYLRNVPIRISASAEEVLRRASVVAFATTAVKPTVASISMCRPGTTILHISLRDLMPDAILHADNIVDDVEHVLRAETSVHLAEQKVGHHNFIRCTLADVLTGKQPPRLDPSAVVAFSPFGLGVLDLALAKLALKYARSRGSGIRVDEFFAGT
jgi:N-[(2S)-2-amino-2-carboxyethyl]-L-glutamate dehydrogenase